MDEMNIDIAKATLGCAQSDVGDERERARALDGKLVSIASFSGVALSIGASVGATVVVSDTLPLGFTIALGAVLSIAAILLFAATMVALIGLSPKSYRGIELSAAVDRVSPKRLTQEDSGKAIGELAATYYRGMLPEARKTNEGKVRSVRCALLLVGGGLGGLVLALILSTVAAVA